MFNLSLYLTQSDKVFSTVRGNHLDTFLPEQVSSSCGQRHGGNQQPHPTTCCGQETAGCLCMDPDTQTHTVTKAASGEDDVHVPYKVKCTAKNAKSTSH